VATYSKIYGSVGTTGLGVKVAATAIGSGTTIHTAHATDMHIVTIYAVNSDTQSRKLTIGWGGTTDPDNLIEVTIPSEAGLVPVVMKLPITSSLVIKAAASAANVIVLYTDISKIA
jgi:hypothetical protein